MSNVNIISNLKITAALAAALTLTAAPIAFAEDGTTLGGTAKDNSASGGSEASGTSKAGGDTKGSSTTVKKSGAMTGAAHQGEAGK